MLKIKDLFNSPYCVPPRVAEDAYVCTEASTKAELLLANKKLAGLAEDLAQLAHTSMGQDKRDPASSDTLAHLVLLLRSEHGLKI